MASSQERCVDGSHVVPGLDPRDGSAGRFRSAFLAWSMILAVVAGAVSTLQAGYGLSQFGAVSMVPVVTCLRSVRELAPAMASSAALFSLITWAHGVAVQDLRPRLRWMIVRAWIAALFGLPAIAVAAGATSLVVARVVFGVSWEDFTQRAFYYVGQADARTGLLAFGLDATLISLLSWFALPWLARPGWRLSAKIVAAWVGLIVVRAVLAFALPAGLPSGGS